VKAAFLFPGQGSQYVGMGKAVADSSPRAKEVYDAASRVAGWDVGRLCFEGPMEELTRTDNLQVSLCATDIAHFLALRDRGLSSEPIAVAGHSLGEYPALFAAGVLDLETVLALVTLRGRLMHREAQKNPGAMAAVIGLGMADVQALCNEAGPGVVAANHNSPEQVVVSGTAEAVGRLAALAKGKGAKAIPLAVSGAWHSPLISGAEGELKDAIMAAKFGEAKCPVVCNVTGLPETDPERLKENLWHQLCSPVLWTDSLKDLEGLADVFIECGPKKVLLGLLKKTLPAARGVSAEDEAGLNEVLAG